MHQEPASRAVAALLRQAIAAGEYRPGERLPSQRVLAQTHGIAMNTAREAYRILAEENLVDRHHGRGVFVTTKKNSTQAMNPQEKAQQLENEIRLLRERVTHLEAHKENQMNSQTIVDPNSAPRGRDPHFVGVDYIVPLALGPNDKQRYRTEAWDLVDGTRAVIVTENGATSLDTAKEKIAAAVTERWGDGAGLIPDIIEDWGDLHSKFESFNGARFFFAPEAQALPIDLDKWAARGLVLPR